jgi:hypothetical protein
MAHFIERNIAVPRRLLEELLDRVHNLTRCDAAASGMCGNRLPKPRIEIGSATSRSKASRGNLTGVVSHGRTLNLGECISIIATATFVEFP